MWVITILVHPDCTNWIVMKLLPLSFLASLSFLPKKNSLFWTHHSPSFCLLFHLIVCHLTWNSFGFLYTFCHEIFCILKRNKGMYSGNWNEMCCGGGGVFEINLQDLDAYYKGCLFLPKLNNEIASNQNATYKDRLSSLNHLVLIMVFSLFSLILLEIPFQPIQILFMMCFKRLYVWEMRGAKYLLFFFHAWSINFAKA